MAGSNVLDRAGRAASATSSSAAGYGVLGLPGDMVPNAPNTGSATNDFIESRLGLLFHLDSAFVRGILERVERHDRRQRERRRDPGALRERHGQQPAQPDVRHLPARARDGELLTLIGSESSESGGNSMSPSYLIDPSVRPTKVDRTSDVTGLVDTGKLVGLLDQDDAVRVMESIQRLSDDKLARVNTGITRDAVIKDLVRCNYVKAADLTDRYGDPSALNPELDPDIVGPAGIFTRAEFDNDDRVPEDRRSHEARHQRLRGRRHDHDGRLRLPRQGRATGELTRPARGPLHGRLPRVRRAPRRAADALRVQRRLALTRTASTDNSADGRGKFDWSSDNQQTAASFFLVYNPGGRAQLYTGDNRPPEQHQQIGWFRQRRLDRDRGHAGREQREPAGGDRDPELHGPARRTGPVRDPVPGNGLGSATLAGQPHRVQSDRQRHHCVTCAETAGAP